MLLSIICVILIGLLITFLLEVVIRKTEYTIYREHAIKLAEILNYATVECGLGLLVGYRYLKSGEFEYLNTDDIAFSLEHLNRGRDYIKYSILSQTSRKRCVIILENEIRQIAFYGKSERCMYRKMFNHLCYELKNK